MARDNKIKSRPYLIRASITDEEWRDIRKLAIDRDMLAQDLIAQAIRAILEQAQG